MKLSRPAHLVPGVLAGVEPCPGRQRIGGRPRVDREDEVAAGSSAIVTFSFSHGCEGSPTTQVRIQMPESIPTVAPTVNANWDAEKVMETLDAPIEGSHGEQITERVSEVVYTAKTPIADGYRDTFELSVNIPEDAAGTTIYFPTIQTCEAGETAWIELPAEGQDPEELEVSGARAWQWSRPPTPKATPSQTTAAGDRHAAGARELPSASCSAPSRYAARNPRQRPRRTDRGRPRQRRGARRRSCRGRAHVQRAGVAHRWLGARAGRRRGRRFHRDDARERNGDDHACRRAGRRHVHRRLRDHFRRLAPHRGHVGVPRRCSDLSGPRRWRPRPRGRRGRLGCSCRRHRAVDDCRTQAPSLPPAHWRSRCMPIGARHCVRSRAGQQCSGQLLSSAPYPSESPASVEDSTRCATTTC